MMIYEKKEILQEIFAQVPLEESSKILTHTQEVATLSQRFATLLLEKGKEREVENKNDPTSQEGGYHTLTLKLSLDLECLDTIAWFHDVAKFDLNPDGTPKFKKENKISKNEQHHGPVFTKEILSNLVLRNPQYEEWVSNLDPVIYQLIETHTGTFAPTSYHWECSILRICDKLDKIRKSTLKSSAKKRFKKWEDAEESCHKTMDAINSHINVLISHDVQGKGVLYTQTLEDFNTIYRTLYQECTSKYPKPFNPKL